jgi:malate dehydrogenase (oxaloacetate-decarboxylating)
VRALVKDGLSEAEAWKHVYVLDSRGLVTSDRPGLDEYKQQLARDPAEVAGWQLEGDRITLHGVIVNAKPTVLYGLSGHPGTIDERMVRAMSAYCDHPIIFPMSNPTANCEAVPQDLLAWSDGRAIVATGSPFAACDFLGKTYRFSQANNVAVFPGVGLGAMFCQARIVTPEMMFVAGEALHAMTEQDDYDEGLVLPPNRDLREMAVQVGAAVATQAWDQGVARRERPEGDLRGLLRAAMYVPHYREYVPVRTD